MRRLFPANIDNHFRGPRVALWLFALITLQRIALSFTHMFKSDGGAQSVSTMPLDTYPAGAAQNIIGLMARMGLEQFLLALLMLLALFRYRSMIPLMYLLLVLQYVAGRGVAFMKPLSLAGTSGASTPLMVVAALAAVGLILSLSGRGYREDPALQPNAA
jgi:hypothetical protein